MARRHAAHLGRREVHRRGDQQPGLQPREHRRLRPHHQRRHARPAHRGAALRRGLRALPAAVHARHAAQARARGARHRHRQRLQPRAARHRPVPRRRMEDRRVHPARGGGQLLAGRRPAAHQDAALQVHPQHQHAHQPAEERGSGHGGDVPVGQAPRGGGDSRRARPAHRRQRLRARHHEPAGVPGLRRRAGAPGAHPRRRSRAHHHHHPRRSGADHAWAGAAGVVGPQPADQAVRLRPGAGQGAARRGRLEGRQRRRRAREGRPALRLHPHHPGRLRRPRERRPGAAAPVQGRRRRGRRAAPRRHQHQQAVVRGQVPRDAALVAAAGGSGADAVLRQGPHAAARPQHQLRVRRRADRARSTPPIAA